MLTVRISLEQRSQTVGYSHLWAALRLNVFWCNHLNKIYNQSDNNLGCAWIDRNQVIVIHSKSESTFFFGCFSLQWNWSRKSLILLDPLYLIFCSSLRNTTNSCGIFSNQVGLKVSWPCWISLITNVLSELHDLIRLAILFYEENHFSEIVCLWVDQ